MKKFALAGVALAAVLSLAACYSPGERAAGGALIGGAGGALVGAAASGGTAGGTLAGAAIGAAGGAIVGAATTPRRRYGYYCRSYGYDYYGRRVCVR